MQAQTAQAQPLLRLPALKQLINELADRRAQHSKAKQEFLAVGSLVAALQGLGSLTGYKYEAERHAGWTWGLHNWQVLVKLTTQQSSRIAG